MAISRLTMVSPADTSEQSHQLVCLKCKQNYTEKLVNFLNQEKFCDVTLVCEEKLIFAHKLILAMCSSYFQNILTKFEKRDSILIFKDIKHSVMTALIDFMYKGELLIQQGQVVEILEAAQFLKINGLLEGDGNHTSKCELPMDKNVTETVNLEEKHEKDIHLKVRKIKQPRVSLKKRKLSRLRRKHTRRPTLKKPCLDGNDGGTDSTDELLKEVESVFQQLNNVIDESKAVIPKCDEEGQRSPNKDGVLEIDENLSPTCLNQSLEIKQKPHTNGQNVDLKYSGYQSVNNNLSRGNSALKIDSSGIGESCDMHIENIQLKRSSCGHISNCSINQSNTSVKQSVREWGHPSDSDENISTSETEGEEFIPRKRKKKFNINVKQSLSKSVSKKVNSSEEKKATPDINRLISLTGSSKSFHPIKNKIVKRKVLKGKTTVDSCGEKNTIPDINRLMSITGSSNSVHPIKNQIVKRKVLKGKTKVDSCGEKKTTPDINRLISIPGSSKIVKRELLESKHTVDSSGEKNISPDINQLIPIPGSSKSVHPIKNKIVKRELLESKTTVDSSGEKNISPDINQLIPIPGSSKSVHPIKNKIVKRELLESKTTPTNNKSNNKKMKTSTESKMEIGCKKKCFSDGVIPMTEYLSKPKNSEQHFWQEPWAVIILKAVSNKKLGKFKAASMLGVDYNVLNEQICLRKQMVACPKQITEIRSSGRSKKIQMQYDSTNCDSDEDSRTLTSKDKRSEQNIKHTVEHNSQSTTQFSCNYMDEEGDFWDNGRKPLPLVDKTNRTNIEPTPLTCTLNLEPVPVLQSTASDYSDDDDDDDDVN